MAHKVGRVVALSIGGSTFTGVTSDDIDFTRDMVDVTDKDSSGSWKEFLPGEKETTITFEALYDKSGTYSLDQVFNAMNNGELVAWVYAGSEASQTSFSGSGYVDNVKWTNGKNDASGVSGSIKPTGVVTRSTTS
jgi:TP901-1 family phage major tail protein